MSPGMSGKCTYPEAPKKRGSRRSHNGGVALLVREKMFEVDSHPLITSQHQATLWTLRSKTLRHPFHITGVYSSPASGDPNIPGDTYAKAQQVRDLYQCLAEHNIESPSEVHLTVGDFNSHIGTEQENHITLEESKHVPIRQGDPHPAHQPTITLRDDNTTMNAKSRGQLLLNLLNSTSQLVANGRLESPQNPNFPAKLTRTRTNESLNLISRTIVDYIIIGKQHWDSVHSCTIHRGSHLETGSSPGNPTLEPCDHELLTISVEIPGSPPNTSEPPHERPERLQFHTDKLKENPTLEKFQHALELSSTHALGRMEDTLSQYTAATLDRETLINTLHGIFTQNLQKVATSTLGKLKNHPPHHKIRKTSPDHNHRTDSPIRTLQ
jgi:hypothetical protein